MSYSNYLEDAINNAVCTPVPTLDINAVYIKLHIGDPGEDCTSNAAAETTRQVVTFGASASGVSTSDVQAQWTNVSTTETYSHISLWDHVSAGNALGYGALTIAQSVTAGNTFTIASGALTFSSD
jgi:hypothetical protein